MLRRTYLVASLFLAALVVLGAATVQAAPVGTFLQVEGQVDLLKGGKLPATPVKVQDGVEVGDVVRTKSESRAQIKFVDDTVLTIAPESRVTVEEYMFDGAKGERKAVLGVLRGMVHTAVEKVYRTEEPDFVIKTHTAVMGVRGTKWYTKLLPNATDVYTEASKLEVKNLLPEYPGVVLMGTLQYVRVGMFLNPTVPVNITKEDLKLLARQVKIGIGASSQSDLGPMKASGMMGPQLLYTMLGVSSYEQRIYSGFYVPPRPQPPPAVMEILPPYFIQIIWGPGAQDLDLWLTGPLTEGERFQVFYGNKGALDVVPYAQYYIDCTTSGGSEVIALGRFIQGGNYRVTVHNYTERNNPSSTTLSDTADLTIEIIKGGQVVERQSSGGGLASIVQGGQTVMSLTPPTGQQGIAWEAMEINPANGQINKINQIRQTFNP